jgi:hypothetical protein
MPVPSSETAGFLLTQQQQRATFKPMQLSRQVRWQRKKIAEGICPQCGVERLTKRRRSKNNPGQRKRYRSYCVKCREKARAYYQARKNSKANA